MSLPTEFLNWNPGIVNQQQKISLNKEGYWSCFIFVPISLPKRLIQRLNDGFLKTLDPISLLNNIKFSALSEEYHISLSKILSLPYHLLEPFKRDLRVAISKCNINSFDIKFIPYRQPTKCFFSENETRCFIAWRISNEEPLKRLLNECIHPILNRYKLPLFYDPPIFHLSWAVSDVIDQVDLEYKKNLLEELILSQYKKWIQAETRYFSFDVNHETDFQCKIDCLHLKLGGRAENSIVFPFSNK